MKPHLKMGLFWNTRWLGYSGSALAIYKKTLVYLKLCPNQVWHDKIAKQQDAFGYQIFRFLFLWYCAWQLCLTSNLIGPKSFHSLFFLAFLLSVWTDKLLITGNLSRHVWLGPVLNRKLILKEERALLI